MTSTELDVPTIEISFDTPNRERFLRDDFRNRRDSYAILGRGSYGVVIKASYRGRPVAVKILEKRSQRHRSRYDSLVNEANALKLRHDNIITVLKIVDGAQYGLVLMERFDGQCLQRILGHPHDHRIAVQHKLLILCDIISGLCFCHRQKIVHLDVKPQNVIVTLDESQGATRLGCPRLRNYRCKLCDFGSSMLLVPWQRNETLVNRGTIRYMAPELLRGQQRTSGGITERADIYSFGITMWQLDEERVLPYEEITCNEVVAYNVVKRGLRPDNAPMTTGGTVMLHDIACLHGSLRAPIPLSGGFRFSAHLEPDAVDDILRRQGIAVEYRRCPGFKGRNRSPIGAICSEGETNDQQEFTAARFHDVLGNHCTLSAKECAQLREMMRTLYGKCWLNDPANRPDAATVRATIHQAMKRLAHCRCIN